MTVWLLIMFLNGDPNYDDGWRDIAGHATLIERNLNGEDK